MSLEKGNEEIARFCHGEMKKKRGFQRERDDHGLGPKRVKPVYKVQQRSGPIKIKHVAGNCAEKINPLEQIANSARAVGSRELAFWAVKITT